MPGWARPKRIVLHAHPGHSSKRPLEAAAPGVEIRRRQRTRTRWPRKAADADAIFGGDNVVCDDRVLAAAKKVRWVAVVLGGRRGLSRQDGLERPGVVVTNMRAVAGPGHGRAHHRADVRAVALTAGVDRPAGDAARAGAGNFAGSQPQSLTGKTMLVAGLGGIGTRSGASARTRSA